jgi:hypothetical protein
MSDIYLSAEHLIKLVQLSERVEKALLIIKLKQQEDTTDELTLRAEIETVHRKQAEFQLRRHQRMAEINTLSKSQGAAVTAYDTFKKELCELYRVDLTNATIDDETGRIVHLDNTPTT